MLNEDEIKPKFGCLLRVMDQKATKLDEVNSPKTILTEIGQNKTFDLLCHMILGFGA